MSWRSFWRILNTQCLELYFHTVCPGILTPGYHLPFCFHGNVRFENFFLKLFLPFLSDSLNHNHPILKPRTSVKNVFIPLFFKRNFETPLKNVLLFGGGSNESVKKGNRNQRWDPSYHPLHVTCLDSWKSDVGGLTGKNYSDELMSMPKIENQEPL